MLAIAILLLAMQARVVDPVRAAEAAEALVRARIAAQSQNIQSRIEDERRDFEQKFNTLLKAMVAFSQKYNDGKGEVWPMPEGEILRKAIAEFQKVTVLQANRRRSDAGR